MCVCARAVFDEESVVSKLVNPENKDLVAMAVGAIGPCISAPIFEEVLYRSPPVHPAAPTVARASPPVPPASPLPPNLRQFHFLRLRAPPPLPSFRFTLLGACAQAWPVPAECSTPALIFLVQPRPPRPPSCPPGVPPVCRAPPRVMAGLGSACRRVSGPRHAHASARRGVCGGVGAAASGAASR